MRIKIKRFVLKFIGICIEVLMINFKNIDVSSLKETFAKNRRIVIDNFLDEEFANKLLKYYAEEMPKNLWCATYMPSLRFNGDWEWWKNIDGNRYNKDIGYAYASLARENNMFAYYFYKTINEQMGDYSNTVHQETMDLFSGKEIKDLLNEITQLNLTGESVFVSRYSERCFLTRHSDDPNGQLAFVFHLTKNWNPDWGGLYLDLRNVNDIRAICPTFNKMVIFEVTNESSPHAVTQVVDNINKERISVTGWYK